MDRVVKRDTCLFDRQPKPRFDTADRHQRDAARPDVAVVDELDREVGDSAQAVICRPVAGAGSDQHGVGALTRIAQVRDDGREVADGRVVLVARRDRAARVGGERPGGERDLIARGIFTSVKDLDRKIMRYIRSYNRKATPIKWSYKDVSNRIKPALESSDTAH